jgi:lysophospholipase L1-like esterase
MKQITVIVLVIVLIVGVIGGILWWSGQRSQSNQPVDQAKTDQVNQKRKLVALGSSISTAHNLSSELQGDNKEYSFATGIEIESVYQALKDWGEEIAPINLASAGATTEDILANQLENVLSYNPKFVVLDPGADLVSEVPVEKFESNLNQIIKKLGSNDRIIMIINYPNFVRLRQSHYQSCKQDKLSLGSGLSNLDRARIKQFNQVIEKVSEQNNLILADIYQILSSAELSDFDCLHPSIDGQKKIAQKLIQAYGRQ